MDSYFIHNKCGGYVYLNLTSNIRFISSFGIKWNNLIVGMGKLINLTEKEKTKTEFFCPNCTEIVEPKDLDGICLYCGKYFNLAELFTLSESGGMYCNEHSIKENENRKSIITIIKNVVF